MEIRSEPNTRPPAGPRLVYTSRRPRKVRPPAGLVAPYNVGRQIDDCILLSLDACKGAANCSIRDLDYVLRLQHGHLEAALKLIREHMKG